MKILYTSAMIDIKKDERIIHYKKSFEYLTQLFKRNIDIVECFSTNQNDLNEIYNFDNKNLLITKTHNDKIMNKGVLELLGIQKYLEIYNDHIDDNEVILKITGRYLLLRPDIVSNILENENISFCGKLVDNDKQVFTGCFSIRKKTLIDFIKNVDLVEMERSMINFEKILKVYLENCKEKIILLNQIGIEAPIFGTGDIQTVFL